MSLSYFNYLGKLADSGVLGVICTLLILAVIYLFTQWRKEVNHEIEEKEKMIVVLKSSNDTLERVLEKEKFIAHIERSSEDDCEKKEKSA